MRVKISPQANLSRSTIPTLQGGLRQMNQHHSIYSFFLKGFALTSLVIGLCVSPIYSDTINKAASSLEFNKIEETGTYYYSYVQNNAYTTKSNNFIESVRAVNIGANTSSVSKSDEYIRMVSFGIKNMGNNYIELAAKSDPNVLDEDSDIDAKVIGEALVYPSPFKQQEESGFLGYELSKDMNVELHIYDMLANLILQNSFEKGATGGKKGYNKCELNLDTFGGHVLSAGVYFFVLLNDGEVLTKGKMGVLP